MKKFLFFSLTAMALIASSCSGSGSKVDVKKDATQLNKSLVETIDKAKVTTREDYDALKMRLDSMETVFYESYKYKLKADTTNGLRDSTVKSVRAYFDKSYREKINKALDEKAKSIKEEAPQVKEAPKANDDAKAKK